MNNSEKMPDIVGKWYGGWFDEKEGDGFAISISR